MQAASACCFLVQPVFPTTIKPSIVILSPYKAVTTTCLTTTHDDDNNNNNVSVKGSASSGSGTFKSLSVNYNSPYSVFPAEACEVVGGDAYTAAVIYPEAKLDRPKNVMNQPNPDDVMENFDREYFDYTSDPKSVLRDEACDDLGGEFCEAS